MKQAEFNGICPKCKHNKFRILNPSMPIIQECTKCKYKWNPDNEKNSALESEFAPKDESSINFNLQNEKELNILKDKALESCEEVRGHDMGEWEDNVTQFRTTSYSTCKNCGRYVQVNTNPSPDGIDIGGDAVAISCDKAMGIQRATPEEIHSTFGIK